MTEFHSQNRTWKSAQHLLDTDDLADGAIINLNDELFQITTKIEFIVKYFARTSMFRITYRHFSTGSGFAHLRKNN